MKKIIISVLFLSSFVVADFPYNVPPFGKQEKLLKDCVVDLLCGEYLYETGFGETGSARIFKYKDVYYIHYIRDDEIEYIGFGVLSSNYLAVTYIILDLMMSGQHTMRSRMETYTVFLRVLDAMAK